MTTIRDILLKIADGQPLKNRPTTKGPRKGAIPIRNPNKYGSVVKLSGNRRRPFMVRGGVYGYDDRGYPLFDIIGYTATREEGNIMLAEYNRDPWDVDKAKITLQGLFNLWKEKKAPKLGESNRSSLYSAFKHCSKLVNLPYKKIRSYQMQETIDGCGKGYSTQAAIKNLWGHLDRFALELDIITRCYSELLTSEAIPETTRDRFSDDEIQRIWEHQNELWVDSVLVFIYAGWRINELLNLKKTDVDIQLGTMTGGVKTRNGKNRIVPIHPFIRPFVERRMKEPGEYLFSRNGKKCPESTYRTIWKGIMDKLNIEKTPHEGRHTLESLLDSAKANRKCIDLIMGHKSKDTGNRVYNHKTLDELKEAIELIKKDDDQSTLAAS